MNRPFLTRASLIASITLLSACGSGPDPLPKHVIFEAPSPNGDAIAVIYLEKLGRMDMLGGDDRAWLGIRYPETECILRKELTEGTGTYEGGILDLKWLNDTEILVERAISDQRRDIVYNTRTHSWRDLDPP